jgi:ABC-type polysaccharide/polyol phosphate export permease
LRRSLHTFSPNRHKNFTCPCIWNWLFGLPGCIPLWICCWKFQTCTCVICTVFSYILWS